MSSISENRFTQRAQAALRLAQEASAQWIDRSGTQDTPEANALRQRVGQLFQRAQGTMN